MSQPAAPVTYSSPPADKTWQAHLILNEFYGPLPVEPRRSPMRELISTVLSHRTTHRDEELAYDRMLETFGDWQGVLDAPTAELAHAIRTTRWPDTQAPRIQEILRRIKAEFGEFKLDALLEWPMDKGLEWLTDMPGIGLKTASLVLLFNFKKPVLPVDTHVHRVAQRVGMIGPKTSVEKAHQVLLAQLPKDAVVLLNFHKHNYWLGQHICFFSRPNCPACPLKGFCSYYLEHHGPADAAAMAQVAPRWEGEKLH